MAEAKVHLYKVEMTCEGCSGAVERVLGKYKDKGVEDFNVNLGEKLVKVKTTLSSDEILEVLKKTGKTTEFVKTL